MPKSEISTQVLVLGAGPAGLYCAFQLGLLDICCQVVDAQDQVGGQCQALYGPSTVYDAPGYPAITAAALSQQLLAQLQQLPAFAPDAATPSLHLGQHITHLSGTAASGFELRSAQGLQLRAKYVVLAAGAGAILPKLPALTHLAAITPAFIHTQAPAEMAPFAGHDVCILGDSDAAVQWACDLAEHGHAASVTLSHRRSKLAASSAAQARLEALCAAGHVRFVPALLTGLHQHDGQPQALYGTAADGQPLELPCQRLGLFFGISPQMGALREWGLALERKQLPVQAATMHSAHAQIYAIGDLASYPGKLKLLAAAFHEATLAAYAIQAHSQAASASGPLQYSSSSALLQSRLRPPPRKPPCSTPR